MVQFRVTRWVKNDYIHHSLFAQMLIDLKWWVLAQRQTDARLFLMYTIVHTLVLIEAIKHVKLHRNLLNLQHILAN